MGDHSWSEPNVSHRSAPTSADCAPLKPTPLRGLLGLGARLLDRELWPEDYRHNPLMVYFTGRRGAFLEVVYIGSPWFFLGGINIMIVLEGIAAHELQMLLHLLLFQGIAFPFFAGQQACLVVNWAGRKHLGELNIEEIFLTRLTHREIVHGLSIRPLATLAVVHFGFMLNQLVLLALIVLWSMLGGAELDLFLAMVAFVTYVAVYYMMSISAEMGAAHGLRSALYIRRSALSRLRGLNDHALSRLGFISALMLAALFFILMINSLLGLLVLPVVVVLASRSQADSRDILTQCGNFPRFWWALRDAQEEARVPWLRLRWDLIFGAFREYEREERRLARPEDYAAGAPGASLSGAPDGSS